MRQKPYYLTKSRFKIALECPTKLFYTSKDEYANLMVDDEFLMALAEGGFQVGELAKYYHPGGYDIVSLDYHESLEQTNKLLQKENVIIYEPAIQFENFFIRVDVLVKIGNNVDLIEVKAKSFDSENKFYSKKGYLNSTWRPYLYDVAFQHFVTQCSFPDWTITPYLMLADKNKKTSVDALNQVFQVVKDNQGRKTIEINHAISNEISEGQIPKESSNTYMKIKKILGDEILTKVDVIKPVQMIWNGDDIDPKNKSIEDNKNFFERAREYSKYYLEDRKYPAVVGSKCKNCEFKNDNHPELKSGYEECWKSSFPDFSSSKPHIFNIWNYRNSQALIDKGIYTLDDFYSSGDLLDKLNERQYMQVEKTVNRSDEEYIDTKLFSKIDNWNFPLHFIDFETSMIAVPFHKERHPYEQIAFQFSCHTLEEDNTIHHQEWISINKNKFPNYDFVKALKDILDKDEGTIFRYAAHENTVLRQIQQQMANDNEDKHGEWIEWIDTITRWKDSETKESFKGKRDMVDLLEMIRDYYYHPKMAGSNSIKSVLPAIFSSSNAIKDIYSKPLAFGKNLKNMIMWKEKNGVATDPYKLLPNTYQKLDISKDDLFFDSALIHDGAAATTAYAKLQFTQMSDSERKALIEALLQYCELDTLAMLMIYQHWQSKK